MSVGSDYVVLLSITWITVTLERSALPSDAAHCRHLRTSEEGQAYGLHCN